MISSITCTLYVDVDLCMPVVLVIILFTIWSKRIKKIYYINFQLFEHKNKYVNYETSNRKQEEHLQADFAHSSKIRVRDVSGTTIIKLSFFTTTSLVKLSAQPLVTQNTARLKLNKPSVRPGAS